MADLYTCYQVLTGKCSRAHVDFMAFPVLPTACPASNQRPPIRGTRKRWAFLMHERKIWALMSYLKNFSAKEVHTHS